MQNFQAFLPIIFLLIIRFCPKTIGSEISPRGTYVGSMGGLCVIVFSETRPQELSTAAAAAAAEPG